MILDKIVTDVAIRFSEKEKTGAFGRNCQR